MKRALVLLVAAVGLWFSQAGGVAVAAHTALPVAEPAAEGISAGGLQQLHEFMQHHIDEGEYLGAVTLIARHGKIVDWQVFGHSDLARTRPMTRDAIFRIFSMSKTITSVAVLQLVEQGKLGLDDPLRKFLPEFADMRVFVGGTADAPRTRPAAREITIRYLLIHAAGFAVGGPDNAEAVKLLERERLDEAPDLKTYCQRLSRLPLAADPGERFNYDGVQIVVLSRLVEAVAGMPFDRYLQQRVFAALDMKDTGFIVPEAQRGRLVQLTSTDRDGKLIEAPTRHDRALGGMISPYFSGAGGLYSTASDYLRFSQMLLNGGQVDGTRVLREETVTSMMSNQLGRLHPPVQEFREGDGFGLGGYVVVDPARRGRAGSVGQFGWSGAASTYYAIDRERQLIALLMMQHLPQGLPRDPPKIAPQFYNRVYDSLLN